MKTIESLERDLAELGRELGTRDDLPQRVLDEVYSRATLPVAPQHNRRTWFTRRRAIAAVAAGVLACLTSWWLATPATLYARVLVALERAKTVHVTGWTRDVFRKWPLESPTQKAAGNVRHPVEAWYWSDAQGMPSSYEKFGPVIRLRRGGNLREYQEDVKLLFVHEGGRAKDFVDKFSSLAEHLKTLDRPHLTKAELGTRRDGDRTLKGWRVTSGDKIEEFWLDARTDLPVRHTAWLKREGGQTPISEMTLSFNAPVPPEVVRYEPPKTESMRYGGQNANAELAWRQHVQELGLRLQNEPIRGRVALLPRENGKTFGVQWVLRTPDGKFWVAPLDLDQYQRMSLADFIRMRAGSSSGEQRFGTWRLPREFHKLELRHDLVYEAGTPWREWVGVVLNHFGLEVHDVVEERTVWIARHDGRALKPWQQVQPPVPYIVENGVEKKGMVRPGIGHKLVPVTLEHLFDDFNYLIDSRELAAKRPLIFDETGLPRPPRFDAQQFKNYEEYHATVIKPKFLAATDSPWFVGDESLPMARDWYAKEFGITFTEEKRPLTVHVVRQKQPAK